MCCLDRQQRNGDGDRLDLGLAVDALLLAAPP
jgi:hypothetical protein